MKNIRELVENSIIPIGQETIDVFIAKGRVTGLDIKAPRDYPLHDETVRDGFVVADPVGVQECSAGYRISGEIAAGATDIPALFPGAAYRIYTGAVIPEGGTRVVPFEACHEDGDILTVNQQAVGQNQRYIRKKGSVVTRDDVLVEQGVILQSEHIGLLASLTVESIRVSRLPIVAYYCTGSELVEPGVGVSKGMKSSINGWILDDLLPCFGGTIKRSGLLPDEHSTLESMFVEATDGSMDLVVTTGGMGPGKYDLVKSAFLSAGGEVITDSLPMRPGKSLLIGKLNGVIVMALPGPPQAVRTLIAELVGPVLLLMQGGRKCWPEPVEGEILHDIDGSKEGIVKCRSGVFTLRNGRCYVRETAVSEPASCIIVLSPEQKRVAKGEKVTVHLL